MKIDLKSFLGKVNIVGVIASEKDLQMALADPDIAHIFDWRVDLFYREDIRNDLIQLARPLIVTVRDSSEGGKNRGWGIDARASLYKEYLDIASFVDIEASTVQRLTDVIDRAHIAGVGTIISLHNLRCVPSDFYLRAAVDVHRSVGGDIFKVAVTPKDLEELCWFFERMCFFQKSYGIHIAPMAMETFGKISRLIAGFNNSPLVYTSLDAPVVSGQWKASLFKQALAQVMA